MNWVELRGSHKPVAPGAKVGDLRAPGESVEILVVVRRPKPLEFPKGNQPHMTHAEYAAEHSASTSDINEVKAFAKQFDLEINAVMPVERSIILHGNVAGVSKAFQLELRTHYFRDGTSYRGREGTIHIPAALEGIVTGVFGLDDRPVVRTHVRWKNTSPRDGEVNEPSFQPPTPFRAFFPNELAALYNFPAGTDGRGQTIGIVELAGGFKQSELDTYFRAAEVADPPTISVATVPGGGTNTPEPDARHQPDVEVLLDIEVVGAAAPGAKIVMYFAKGGSNRQTLLAVQTAVHDRSAKPDVLSLSWGAMEYDVSLGGGPAIAKVEEQYQNAMNDLFQTAGVLGITVCVSSGDNGSAAAPINNPRRPWDGHAHVDFPASSPFALAVGGTHIVDAAPGNLKEEVWHPAANDGTGGGISRYFERPDYQKTLVTLEAVNPPGTQGRGVPDVSADAAQESGYRILVDGQWFQGQDSDHPPVGGTSGGAPLWAALIARLNQALNTRLGFVNPALYEVASSSPAFHDVRAGNNGDYKATPGWDACTGLGTPNGEQLLAALKKQIAPKLVKAVTG
jgi:kumamolisin